MTAPAPAPARSHEPEPPPGRPLTWLLLVVTLLFAAVLWPLHGAILWAMFLAIVFAPVQRRAVRVCRGRHGWAAFGTLLLIVVSVLLPTALLATAVTHQAMAAYEGFRTGDAQLSDVFAHGFDALPAWAKSVLDHFDLANLPALQQKVTAALGRYSQEVTTRVFTIGRGTLEFAVQLLVMVYLLFFFLRDGERLAALAERAAPFERLHTQRLIEQFASVVRATVKGNFAISLLHGFLGGLAFWVLGIKGAVLWGAVMAVLALLPVVGAPLVWGPAAIYLVATGSPWQAAALVVWGTAVIGLVDNLLRPVLVGRETQLPDYVVLAATLGGLAAFGLNGFVIGPVIAAICLATWDIVLESRGEPRGRTGSRP